MNWSVAFGIVGVASSMLFTKASRSARSDALREFAIVPSPSLWRAATSSSVCDEPSWN